MPENKHSSGQCELLRVPGERKLSGDARLASAEEKTLSRAILRKSEHLYLERGHQSTNGSHVTSQELKSRLR